MPDFAQSFFPSLDQIMQLARSIVNDTFPGTGGQQGRILTNDAPFTLPYLNNAFDTLQRKLRNEGVTFPIKDNFILTNVTPVVTPSPNVQVYVGFSGYFDGTNQHPTPSLPNDLMQPYELWEQDIGSGLRFDLMSQSQSGLPSVIQGRYLSVWEWRNYQIVMPGSTVAKNLRLRYKSGQPPLNVLPAQFASTNVQILDSKTVIAYLVAAQYAEARGADATKLEAKAQDAIDDMANEYVRRAQTVPYRRKPYGGDTENAQNTGANGMVVS